MLDSRRVGSTSFDRERWRVGRGILAASLTTFAILLLWALLFALRMDSSGIYDALNGATGIAVYSAAIVIPAVFAGCALVFGAMFLVLRTVGWLSTWSFAVGAAILAVVLGIADSGPMSTWSAFDYAMFAPVAASGWAIGYAFARFARPESQRDRS